MNHLELAHSYWEKVIREGDHAIDATCGNGKDTLRIARLTVMHSSKSHLIGIDTQLIAIERTKNRLASELTEEQRERISLYQQCHSHFPPLAYTLPIRLIVYNLGYLPGTDKRVTTRVETTLESITAALELLTPGGLISITCYPGHPEGAREEQALLDYLETKSSSTLHVEQKKFSFNAQSPSLLLLQNRVNMEC
jgi:hypothetical protein